MKKTLIFSLLFISLIIQKAFSCGPMPYIWARSPEYIDSENSYEKNFRLLNKHYLAGMTRSEQPRNEDFDTFLAKTKALFNQKEIEHDLENMDLTVHRNYFYDSNYSSTNNYAAVYALMIAFFSDPRVAEGHLDMFKARYDILSYNHEDNLSVELEELKNTITKLEQNPRLYGWPYYLEAILAFYQGQFDQAYNRFEKLNNSKSTWLKETALYMMARTRFVQSQRNWDGYLDDTAGLDKDLLDRSISLFQSYLSRYPEGLYSRSVISLHRRLALITGNQEEFNRLIVSHYTDFIQNIGNKNKLHELVNEFCGIFNGTIEVKKDHPFLIAYQLFKNPNSISTAELAEEQDRFKPYQSLYRLLRNMLLFNEQKYQLLINETQQSNDLIGPVGFGILVSKAKALTATGKLGKARAVWKSLLNQRKKSTKKREYVQFDDPEYNFQVAVQIEIARTYIRQLDYSGMAHKNSGVTWKDIFLETFRTLAGENDLVKIVLGNNILPEARLFAQNELFNRLIIEKKYKQFLDIYKKVKNPGIYVQVYTAVNTLSKDAGNSKGLLNIGYFLHHHSIKPGPYHGLSPELYMDNHQPIVERLPSDLRFSAPSDYYKKIIENYNNGAKSEVEAKALHYLINCYKNANRYKVCTWGNDKGTEIKGKEWFRRLHSKYPKSKWSAKTRYYYNFSGS